MKSFKTSSALLFLALIGAGFFAASAHAAEVTFVSGDGNETATGNFPVYVLPVSTFGGSLPAIDFPQTRWIGRNDINSFKPVGGYTTVITEKIRVDLPAIASMQIQTMADDTLIVKVNGTQVWSETNDYHVLWNHITYIDVPVNLVKNHDENIIEFVLGQGVHYGGTYMALNYKGVISGSNSCDQLVACPNNKVLSLANNPGSPGEGTQYAVGARIIPATGNVAPPSILTLNKDLTYETWLFKIGNNRYGGILSVGDPDMRHNGWPSLYSSPDGTSLTFRVGQSDKEKQCTGNCHEYTLSETIPTGAWTHVAISVSNGSTLTWYVNGRLAQQQTLAGWNASGSPTQNNVYIGNEVPGASEYINAKLDEIRVWNVVRNAIQIKDTMNRRLAGNETGLVNYWNFDTDTSDLTGNTTSLSLKNGATIIADPAINPLKLCTQNTCALCSTKNETVTTYIGSGDGEKLLIGGDIVRSPYVLAAPSFDQGGGWWAGNAIDYPLTHWISIASNAFYERQGPNANVCYDAIENFTLDMNGGVTSALFDYMVDDWLQLSVNGNAPFYTSGPDWLWRTPTRNIALPINQLKQVGSNVLKVHFCQGGNYAFSQMGVDYAARITGIKTTAPTDPSCSACVDGGRGMLVPTQTSSALVDVPSGIALCQNGSVPIAVATKYQTNKFSDLLCAAATGVFATSGTRTNVTLPTNGEVRCATGQAIIAFAPTLIQCQAATGLLSGTEQVITVANGSALNTWTSLVPAIGNGKTWVPIAVSMSNDKPLLVTMTQIHTAPACATPPRLPPTSTGDATVHAFTLKDDGVTLDVPPNGLTVSLDDGAAQPISAGPVAFLKIGVGGHTFSVTDKPNMTEYFGFCHLLRGGTPCAPQAMAMIPSSQCDGTACTVQVPVPPEAVTRLVFYYSNNPVVAPPPPPPELLGPGRHSCGNLICEEIWGETAESCPLDCAVNPPPPIEPTPTPACTFTSDKTQIIKNVGLAKLSWSCENGTGGVEILPTVGARDASGSVFVGPTTLGSNVYTLKYMKGTADEVVKTVTIEVIQGGIEEQ